MQLQVIWHMLYTEDSAADQCTLYQLRNLKCPKGSQAGC